MLRRLYALLLSLLFLPFAATADPYMPYETHTFDTSLPQQLEEPLAGWIPADAAILSGAVIAFTPNCIEPDEPASFPSYAALVLVKSDDALQLLAAAWVDSMPWQVNDYTRFLRTSENVSIGIYQPEANRIPHLRVDYIVEGCPVTDLMIFRGNRLWQFSGHIDGAKNVTIEAGLGSTTIIDHQGRNTYTCAEGFWLDYMNDVSTFPTCRIEVETLAIAAESSRVSNRSAGRGYVLEANLRQEATQKSPSLGVYHANVPLTILGDYVMGKQYLWLQVQIGDTVGWMSSNYVSDWMDQGVYLVPMGRTVDGCALYATPGDNQPIQQMTPGTTFHILTEYKDMYHICIPREEISWAVDTEGIYGYIPQEGILTGAGVSALDALEKAR